MGMETDSPGFNVFLLSPTYRLTQSGVLRLVAPQYDRTRPAIDHLGVEELHLGLRVDARIFVSGGQGQICSSRRNQRLSCTTGSGSPSVDRVFRSCGPIVFLLSSGALLVGTGGVPRSIRIGFCHARLLIAFLAQSLTDSLMWALAGPVPVG